MTGIDAPPDPSTAPRRYPGRGLRWPLEPLLAAAGDVDRNATLTEALGVSALAIYRWRNNGLSTWTADRAAVALGLHPAEVWKEHWWV